MIIEMTGLPGAGKTYLGNAFVELMKSKNIAAVNWVNMRRTSIVYKAMCKAIRCFTHIIPSCIEYRKNLRNILKNHLSATAIYSKASISTYIDNIVEYTSLYKKYQYKKKILVFDEGIIQQLVNIIVNFSLSETEKKELFLAIKSEMFSCVYLKIGINEAIESIISRNRHVCTIDELRGEELNQFLIKYEAVCDLCTERMHSVELYRNDSIEKNMKLLYKLYKARR
ncbi:MAG: hypothetical protein K2G63_07625 [Oscillospiraceae bacterium]|nr:hypothetical protein [Oscillospiraceae bacterium]